MASEMKDLEARASVIVAARPGDVWDALVDPAQIKQYMFGTTVESDWTEGAAISWRGEWQGTAYEDRGRIMRVEPGRLLQYSHFSPLSGLPDEPENYHTVTVTLARDEHGTRVTLTQDGNATEEARQHAEGNWRTMLGALRDHVEGRGRQASEGREKEEAA
jgi:uncharacterized protein YndB with AHSA1/START domain